MGATSGIGLRLAVRLALRRYHVGVAGRNQEILERLKERFPQNIEWERIDITHPRAVERAESLAYKLGGCDLYIHASGVGYDNPHLDPDTELQTVRTDVEGYTRMIDWAYRYFRRTGRAGHIVAITSVAGTKGIGVLASYSASKRFQQTYLEALEQLANMNHVPITFTDIRPGWIRTPLLSDGEHYPMEMTLRHATPRVLRAIRYGLPVVYVDWRWAILSALWRLIPGPLWRHLRIPIPHMGHNPKKSDQRLIIKD